MDVTHLALSDRRGYTKLYFSRENWGHSLVHRGIASWEDVPTDSLRNFLRDKGIDTCDFIKLNCEGAEFRSLLSTPREVLRKFGISLVLYHCDLVEEDILSKI